jgi:dihydropteroate synthase
MPAAAEIKGLGERPLIMGILNVTPDSFSDGGAFLDPEKAVEHAHRMAQNGADIIDIGGESSRPGSAGISAQEEIDRVMPVLERVCREIDIQVSIDTTKSDVAKMALEAGAGIVNDISALRNDESIAKLAADHNAYLILMHMRGTPRDMQKDTKYDDIVGEIAQFIGSVAQKAADYGVSKEKIIIDPGIGFGKSVEGNFVILKNLDRFLELGYPILIGVSRKSFLGETLNIDARLRLEASIAAACYAVLNGADIIRVHDVAETRRALTIIEKIAAAERG